MLQQKSKEIINTKRKKKINQQQEKTNKTKVETKNAEIVRGYTTKWNKNIEKKTKKFVLICDSKWNEIVYCVMRIKKHNCKCIKQYRPVSIIATEYWTQSGTSQNGVFTFIVKL